MGPLILTVVFISVLFVCGINISIYHFSPQVMSEILFWKYVSIVILITDFNWKQLNRMQNDFYKVNIIKPQSSALFTFFTSLYICSIRYHALFTTTSLLPPLTQLLAQNTLLYFLQSTNSIYWEMDMGEKRPQIIQTFILLKKSVCSV